MVPLRMTLLAAMGLAGCGEKDTGSNETGESAVETGEGDPSELVFQRAR